MRKLVGFLLFAAALTGALVSDRGMDRVRQISQRQQAARAAQEAARRSKSALGSLAKEQETRALAATSLSQLAGQLALLRNERLEGPVAATLSDWFSTEPYWDPFRREFPLVGVSTEEAKLGLVLPRTYQRLGAQDILATARQRGVASGFIQPGEPPLPMLAAATRVMVPSRDLPVVLLLAKPLDSALIDALAHRVGSALLLERQGRRLASGGAESARAELERAMQSVAGNAFVAPDATWAAAAFEVLPGVRLWSHATVTLNAAGTPSAGTARISKILVWAAASLVMLAGLFLALRRPAPAPAASTQTPASVAAKGPEKTPRPLVAGGPSAPAGSVPGEATARTAAWELGAGAGGAKSDLSLREQITAVGPRPAEAPVGPRKDAGASNAGFPFGRYLLVDRLGEGGMAQVYSAVIFGAEGFRRRFVIKRLRPELLSDPSVVAQFIDEANSASSLVHSNIVPVLDFGKVGDEYFLATEYILGRDLTHLTGRCVQKAEKGMPVAATLFAAHEVLRALEYAHTKTGDDSKPLGIVHRDVSPSNVLVSARGEVKLFDFGIVKAEGRVTRTQHGVVKGNVNFMSPEQARGLEVDARADLFSLGLLVFFCLTGDVFYHGTTTYELLVKAAGGPGPEELARVAALPEPARAIVGRALQADPAARFQTAAEFAAAVAPFVTTGGAELAALIARHFGPELEREDKRFATVSAGSAPADQPASGGAAAAKRRSHQEP